MPEVHNLGPVPITCHVFNANRTQIALSPNNHELHIYSCSGGTWTKVHTLSEHSQRINGVDWAHKSNLIVTCAADRDAYVWTEMEGTWKPTLVILRINRAATIIKWSPLENKFACGSAARMICIGYFEEENDWWNCKIIKKPMRSTITCLDWHHNNVLLAAGSTDFKARVFSSYIKENKIDIKTTSTAWGKKMTFGNMLAEFSTTSVGQEVQDAGATYGGWVHAVSFSASGDQLAFVGHNSTVYVADAARDMMLVTVKTKFLPFLSCVWAREDTILLAGHSCAPMTFRYNTASGSLAFAGKLDEGKKGNAGNKFSAKLHFQHLDSKGQNKDDGGTSVGTEHQNSINQVALYKGDKHSAAKFSTCGCDGKVCIWDLNNLEGGMGNLRLN